MEIRTITAPFTEDVLKSLHVGDIVNVSGKIFAGRDAVLPKIVSMIDYAVGSLRALSGSGKEVGREGVSYLADVLLSVTRKQIFRMREDRGEAVRHWREALLSMDVRLLPFGCRVRRILMLALCRLIGFLV